MYFFVGGNALTHFQTQQLLTKLQTINAAITELSVSYHFVVHCNEVLNDQQLASLATLLRHSEYQPLPQKLNDKTHMWVSPRLGTISPWRSKATDILHLCGLTQVMAVERVRFYQANVPFDAALQAQCFDPLTESVLTQAEALQQLFAEDHPNTFKQIELLQRGEAALQEADQRLGLALSQDDVAYLLTTYQELGRNPSDAELMMFAQVNSEHCRHKIFNAKWWLDGQEKSHSLFAMIRHTYQQHPYQAIIAYKDNAAVLRGHAAQRLYPDPKNSHYQYRDGQQHIVLKVETHNHPTAISPYAGAATGSGGEIRDEAATGRAAQAKAGMCGFSVSHLNIPDWPQPWEIAIGKPANLASALDIMLEGPIGAAAFNNEFGRPNIVGYFRSFEMEVEGYYGQEYRGYHKPIMLAGGIGQITEAQVEKLPISEGAQLVVLGGPGMAIGLGGGAASSRQSSDANEALDFASVQRANPEMQRRAQEVINACRDLGAENPILSIHDVGAGGLSNALPELVEADGLGASIALRDILIDEPGMTPAEIWCNESQERYVLAIKPESVKQFSAICQRERCPFALVGEAMSDPHLLVHDQEFQNDPVDINMSVLFHDMPKLKCESEHIDINRDAFVLKEIDIDEAVERVLRFPCVASKQFLITIGDRSVGGLISRDQMVGPWQVPVSDVGVTASGFEGYTGEAIAVGERAPIAILHPAASARMAVAEAITNIAAARIDSIDKIALSANWMAAATEMGEGAALYEAVQAIGMEMCPALGISIPVGKDSLSMRASWQVGDDTKKVTSPLSLVITAAAPVSDIRRTLTPELCRDQRDTRLLLIDLGDGCNSLGGSALAQVYQQLGGSPADVSNIQALKSLFDAIQDLNQRELILAYHDRSDGGLLATLAEMMFCSHQGLTVDLSGLKGDPLAALFTEEVGVVIQVDTQQLALVYSILARYELREFTHVVAELNDEDELLIVHRNQALYQQSRVVLQRIWSETSYRLQRLRDNPECADAEFDTLLNTNDSGLQMQLTYDPATPISNTILDRKPKVAILREQGVNGHVEMAAAFMAAGFECVDVHMQDLLNGKQVLSSFVGLAACGGFSYGDVLGAGRGWAQCILMHQGLREQFETFFQRADTFTLGVCNGCQMLAELKSIIPGAEHWPSFQRNQSEQFEARLVQVAIQESPSIFFKGMAGSMMPVVVSHGEGQAIFSKMSDLSRVNLDQCVSMRYVTASGEPTQAYPANPNGSLQGITGLTTPDGRVTIMMPHPERVFRTVQMSWHPEGLGEASPWRRMFENARLYVQSGKV